MAQPNPHQRKMHKSWLLRLQRRSSSRVRRGCQKSLWRVRGSKFHPIKKGPLFQVSPVLEGQSSVSSRGHASDEPSCRSSFRFLLCLVRCTSFSNVQNQGERKPPCP